MFKIIVLVTFFLFIYFILKDENRAVRLSILSYFTLLSIVFLSGFLKIGSKYHLYDGPVLDGGFQSLSEWVSGFSYLYIIPTLLVIAYILLKLATRLFARTGLRAVMYLLWLVILIVLGFVSFFIFTLIFYGFAP